MARQLSFHVWCDLCLPHYEVATFPNLPIRIGGARPRTLDLCEPHYKQLVQPVLLALDEHGERIQERVLDPRPRVGQKRLLGPFRCLAGCTSAPLRNYVTLKSHLRLIHGQTLEEYVARHGELVPLTPQELEVPVVVRCEIEDCDKTYSTATGTRWPQQAMVSHMRGRHGLRWKPGQLFIEATRIG